MKNELAYFHGKLLMMIYNKYDINIKNKKIIE